MKRVLRTALPILVLLAGIAVLFALVGTRPEPERESPEETGAVVDIEVVETRDHDVEIAASGTVIPARRVALTPEIAGRVSWISEGLVPGGRFEAGELMVRLDDRDHRLAMRQRDAEIDSARTELELERGRADVAQREWELFEGAQGEDDESALALREPQLQTAQAALEAAESARSQAQLHIERSRLSAPFNALVTEKNVDVGQHVNPGEPVATLIGTDEFWVEVSIPSQQIRWLDVPGVGATAAEDASSAQIRQRADGEPIVREGYVKKLLGDVEPRGRMARVLVAVDDPLGLGEDGENAGDLPLLSGSYVEVAMEGREVTEAIEIPRHALRDGGRVFTMNDDDRLAVREVTVAWSGQDSVLVTDGLDDGDRIIVSPLSAPTQGMKLRTDDDSDDGLADATHRDAG